jgi:glycosyltransferase involved in cell wall biosynthesis
VSDFKELRGKKFLFAAGHFDYFSGAERQAVYFAEYLVRQIAADVKFIGWGGNGRFADEIRRAGATPVVFPLNPSARRLEFQLTLLSLARFIRFNLKPDYLLPYVAMHCRIMGAVWPWSGTPFCWWNQRDEGRDISGSRLENRLLKHLPVVISNSWEGKEFLTKRFRLANDRVQVVNNGVILPPICNDKSWRASLGIDTDAFVITMLANLTRYKDHLTLLRAFAEVVKAFPRRNLHLVFAGSHYDETSAIKSLAWDLGLYGRLHLPGSICDTDSLLRSTDLVVHSSSTEGCPNGVLEAMAHGLPVLGTNISGLRQALGLSMIDSCLSPIEDWNDLAAKISLRIEERRLCEQEGKANRDRIRCEFSIESMAQNSLNAIVRGTP